MAANPHQPPSNPLSASGVDCLTAEGVRARLEEEISRCERHPTGLSCLMVVVDNLDEMTHRHGEELREQTLTYIAAALGQELRRFDRIGRPSGHELLILLPGAGDPDGEMVARRILERLSTIKIEAKGAREPLAVSVGLSVWREGRDADELLRRARDAARGRNGEDAQLEAGVEREAPSEPA